RVGAALLTTDGQLISGCNIENAAFTPGTCAERTAFAKAISSGMKNFKALAVATDIDGPCSPCGVCRQFAREFCNLNMPIYLAYASFGSIADISTKVKTTTLGELLPMSFGPSDLHRQE
ncbi:cytidine deaminase-like protein, partial [Phakopsora pachyrhizi]